MRSTKFPAHKDGSAGGNLQVPYPQRAIQHHRGRMKTKIRKSKKAAEIVASIDDLLIEMLIRLPVSSRFHFKTVSKHWYSLISKTQFRRWWRNPSNTNSPVGVFFPIISRTSSIDDSFEYLPFCSKSIRKFKDPSSSSSWIKILSSCRGLLLCEIIATRTEEDKKKEYYVYNPTTNQYSATLFVPFTADVSFDNGVYWNHAIHWLNSMTDKDGLYFNVQGQLLGKMPISPPYHIYDNGRRNFYFGNSSDHLHYIPVYLSEEINFNVYEMKRDYSEWFLKYRVDLSPCVAAIPRITATDMRFSQGCRYLFSLLSIVRQGGDHEEEEEDASFLVLQIPGQAVRFNIVPKTFEILHQSKSVVRPAAIGKHHRADGFLYIESLSPV